MKHKPTISIEDQMATLGGLWEPRRVKVGNVYDCQMTFGSGEIMRLGGGDIWTWEKSKATIGRDYHGSR
jgi:hypothetical protein